MCHVRGNLNKYPLDSRIGNPVTAITMNGEEEKSPIERTELGRMCYSRNISISLENKSL